MSGVSAHSADWQHRPALGIGLFVASLAAMSLLGALIKSLSDTYPLSQLLAIRFAVATLAFAITLPSIGGFAGLATTQPLGHALRTVSGIASLGLFYVALASIPLADATALAYSAPIFIVVLSVPLLGEVVGWRRWSAVIAGFAGMILIASPNADSVSIGVLAGIGSAVMGALVSIFLRRLSKTEKTVTIGIYYNFTGTVVFTAWAFSVGWVQPSGPDIGMLLAFGVLAGLQQWTYNHSHRYAEVSLLAPFDYVIFIFAALLGYFFWNEVPTQSTWLGGAIIIASGLIIIARKRQLTLT